MGREIRRVPADWKHPPAECGDLRGGDHEPLFEADGDPIELVQTWVNDAKEHEAARPRDGIVIDGVRGSSIKDCPYWEWGGGPPDPADYMPNWPEAERTHYQMYETCTEGTPLSPVFETPEEVARWCADNGASSFAGMTASYESWLRVANGGFAPSMVSGAGTGLVDGVTAMGQVDTAEGADLDEAGALVGVDRGES